MEVSIRMHVKERVREGMDWTYVGQDREHLWAVVIKVMKFRLS
jgi:hypothetical protein